MKKIFCAFLVLLWPICVCAGQLTASVDKNPLPKGELLELTIQYEGDDANILQPDLSVLQKDFSIYATSTSMQSSYINGVGRQSRIWNISLLPNHDGDIVIPEISAGKYKTEPINLSVGNEAVNSVNIKNDKTNTNAAESPDFDIKLEIADGTYYVQQQINAELIITENRGLQLTDMPRFADNDDWVIKMLSEPTAENKDGKRYIKFYYALFPQKSGKLEVPSARVDSFYISYESAPTKRPFSKGMFGWFDAEIEGLMGIRQPVILRSNPTDVEILSADNAAKGKWWLPAKKLSLAARWVDDKPRFKVGETVAREITLTAMGVAETQLPEITFPENNLWKQYPEQPQYTSVVRDGDVISEEVIRVVYIPQQSGEITLPEINVPWFNVTTGKMQTATIPAEKVNIEAGLGAPISNSEKASPLTPQAMTYPSKNLSENEEEKNNNNVRPQNLWLWLVLAFASGLLLSFLLFYWLQNRRNRQSDELNNIETELKNNDYRSLQSSLIRWGKQHGRGISINNLNDLSQMINQPNFTAQMELLNRVLYAKTKEIPDEKIIVSCLKTYKPTSNKPKNKPLPELYK